MKRYYLLDDTTGICGNEFSKEFETVQGFNMSVVKELFFITYVFYLTLDETHYEQIGDMPLDFPFGCLTSANAFLAYNKK